VHLFRWRVHPDSERHIDEWESVANQVKVRDLPGRHETQQVDYRMVKT
jgi:hypothetical protein